LWNNFLNGDIEIDKKKICLQDIKDTFTIDVNSKTARSMPKITTTHLYPNTWQKMSVKFATQIFSKSVSASIRTCIATGELTSATAEDTAEFVMQINNTFDILNSKNLYDKNPNSRPLNAINNSLFDILKHTRDIFLEAKKVHKNKYKITTTIRNDWLVKWQLGYVIDNTSKVDSLRLCSRHFESYYYDANGKLTIDATPTIFDWEHKKSTNLVPGTETYTITEPIASTPKSDCNTETDIIKFLFKF
ncbi:THAP-type domain-containing protein, partial [Aphis craccivora]